MINKGNDYMINHTMFDKGNGGDRVYRKGITLLEQKKAKIEEVKKLLLMEKDKFYTYTPKINKKSAQISVKVIYYFII